MGVFVVLVCLLCCGYGLMLIFAKDTAFSYVSWRNRNAGIASARTEQWDTMSTVQGAVAIAVGLCLLLLLPRSGPPPQSLPPAITNLRVDGRPATPQERELFEQEMKAGAFGGAKGQPSASGH